MDQSVACGIGNVYRSEVLHRRGIDPWRPGKSLSRDAFDRLWADAGHLLRLGVTLGHIVTVDEADIGKPLRAAGPGERFLVYKRETCRRCGGPVEVTVMAGRTVYACPREQPGA